MTWKDVVAATAQRAGSSEAETRRVLAALTEEVSSRLAEGGRVAWPNLGVLSSAWEPERQLRGVSDGRKVAIDGHWRPRFRASAVLRDRVRSRTPQLLRDADHQRAWRLAETLVGDLSLYHPHDLPNGVTADDGADTVDGRCRASLGAAWERARQTYNDQVPVLVRESRDYLALAARRRWASHP